MRTYLSLLLIALAFGQGCSVMVYRGVATRESVFNGHTNTVVGPAKFIAFSLFANDRMSKLVVDKSTKTTSQGLAIGELSSEVDTESIEAISRGVTEAALKTFMMGAP